MCSALNILLKKLSSKKKIYKSRDDNHYHFLYYKNSRLYFDIPNHGNLKKKYVKSITDYQFCKLHKELFKKKVLYTSDFPFKDCRIGAFYGFIDILYPKMFEKKHGYIIFMTKK